MSSTISTDRLFSLPCFEGLRLLRKYLAGHPELGVSDLLALIERVEVDAHSLDMEASVYFSDIVGQDCPLDGHAFYQSCIKAFLIKHQPIWIKLMTQGRQRFINKLHPNDQDIFAAAGLMENPIPSHVITWWDSLSDYTRSLSDQGKIEQGRAAEMLTLEHERRRLKALAIEREPEWPGLDDNFAGYDVLSYEFDRNGYIRNKLIEVKSTIVSPLRFILTRNEWERAVRAGEAYCFHVWNMNQTPCVLIELSVAEVAPHIPSDGGQGRWTYAQVPVLTH